MTQPRTHKPPKNRSASISAPVGRTLRRGQKVRIERNETRYPPKGNWAQFRGRIGTIVGVNKGEYGVTFGARRNDPYWFQSHELCPVNAPPLRLDRHRNRVAHPPGRRDRAETVHRRTA